MTIEGEAKGYNIFKSVASFLPYHYRTQTRLEETLICTQRLI